MKIKDYKCKCGNDDFTYIAKDVNTTGIYCSKCGKWLKWANKDEKNLCISGTMRGETVMTSEEVRKILDEEYNNYKERSKQINQEAIQKWEEDGWSESYGAYLRNWIEERDKQNMFQFVYTLIERGIM